MITGKIKWFNPFQGYGYIVLFDGTEVYFHGTGIRDSRLMTHLDPGTSVSFDLIHTRVGMEAQNVDLVGI